MLFHNCLPVTLLLLCITTPTIAKFESPDWSQLIKFPSASVNDAFKLQWDSTNTSTPAKLFLWKGPPENFTLVTPIADTRGNTDLRNSGSLTWVIKDGQIPYSGKDYTVELRLNPGVKGKEASQWSDYFEMFNEQEPDPQKDPRPSVFNIGTAAPVASGAAALPTTPAPLPPALGSGPDNSGSSAPMTSTALTSAKGIHLSGGALAGIIIGTIISTALITSFVTFLIVSKRSKRLSGNDIFRDTQPMPPAAPRSIGIGYEEATMRGPGLVRKGTELDDSRSTTEIGSPTMAEIGPAKPRGRARSNTVTELPAYT